MPKHARRESMFFKELKKQDLHVGCSDVQLWMQTEDDDVEPDTVCDEVDGRPPSPRRVNVTQLMSQERHPAAAAADNNNNNNDDDDDDIATEFTSLQSRMSLLRFVFTARRYAVAQRLSVCKVNGCTFLPHRCGNSHAILDCIVLPATRPW